MAAAPGMGGQKLLHSMLQALLDDLGYRGPKKSPEEILPQLHQQSGRRLESTEAKIARLGAHMDELGAQTEAIADEVSSVQEGVSQKFQEMHRLLDEKEAKFKHDVAALAAEVATSISEQEDECRALSGRLLAEKEQLQRALTEENELGFISGIAEMPKHECDIPEALLRVPSVNFQARASINSEPICQLIQNLAFNVQQHSAQHRPFALGPPAAAPSSPASTRPQDSMATPAAATPSQPPWSLAKSQPPSASVHVSGSGTGGREVPASKELFIGGLPFDASEEVLRPIFEKYGTVESIDLSNVSKVRRSAPRRARALEIV